MRPRGIALPVLFATLLVAAAPARAETQVGLLDVIAPGLAGMEEALDLLGRLAAPGAPLAPVAPVLLPAVDFGRILVEVLRATARATVVGAQDGDAGTDLGTPDEVAVGVRERVVADGVAVPGQNATVPGRTVVVATPGVERSIVTPPIGVPGQRVEVPGRNVTVGTPDVYLPPVVVRTPPVDVATPPVHTPPLRLAVPAVGLPGQSVALDASGADLTVQELRGTVHAGPLGAYPYSVGPATVGQSLLPAAVPRQVEAETPPVEVLPGTVLLEVPGQTVLPSQRASVPAQTIPVAEAQRVPGQHVATVPVPGQRVETPPVAVLPGQRHEVSVPAQHVATLEVPGRTVETPGVVVTEERVVVPGTGAGFEPSGALDDLGYVGYGFDEDSSLYPFACTAVVGCQHTKPRLRPWVEYADRLLDTAADLVDGPVVVRV